MNTIQTLRITGREALALVADDAEVVALEVDVLLGEVLACTRTEVIIRRNEEISDEHAAQFQALLKRRAAHEPIAYILGRKEFFGRDFAVNPAVLIPRPETELLVEEALKHFRSDLRSFTLIDVGVGSGAIILSIAAELRAQFGPEYLNRGRFVALDICSNALKVARENAARLGLTDHVEFHTSDLFSSLSRPAVNELTVVVSNPPYIPDSEELPRDVAHYEPKKALFAGALGLDIIQRLLDEAAAKMGRDLRLLIEIGAGQADQIKSLGSSCGYSEMCFHEDLRGIPRVVELLYG